MNLETSYESPLGKMRLRSVDDDLIGLWIEGTKHFLGKTKKMTFSQGESAVSTQTKFFLDDYFNKKNPDPFLIPLSPIGTSFQQKVWKAIREIPYATVGSYYDLAKKIGTRGFQAVGSAVGYNPILILIPCHRVFNKNGNLGGFAGGLDRKKFLLRLEFGEA